MRFDHVTYLLNAAPIPAPVVIVAPVPVGTSVIEHAQFLFVYPGLDDADLLTLLSLSRTMLTAQWPDGGICQIPVQVQVSGPVITQVMTIPSAVLGIGPLGLVQYGANSYAGDPFPTTIQNTITHSLPAHTVIVVTCTVASDTLIVTPQFPGILY